MGNEKAIDAYCGVGTFSLPLAKRVQQVVGIEINPRSIQQAQQNAVLNQIKNASFYTGKVKDYIEQIDFQPDILLLDPPRKGCTPGAIEAILTMQPERIVYISCKPSTLARDIKLLCQSGNYQPVYIQPADFFPQTTHVECCVILGKF